MFCANSFEKRGHFRRCEGAWCGRCYHLQGNDTFPRKSGEYEGWVKEKTRPTTSSLEELGITCVPGFSAMSAISSI